MNGIASKCIIAVVGSKSFDWASDGTRLPDDTEKISRAIGEKIAEKDCWLLCGGLTGVMEAVARGAKDKGGFTIGIIPKAVYKISNDDQDKWPNSYIDVAIFTGLGGGIEGRNKVIINSCDAMIALPGSNEQDKGTRSEIEFAVSKKTPLVLHQYWETVERPIKENRPLVQYFKDAEDAVNKVLKRISDRTYKTTSRR